MGSVRGSRSAGFRQCHTGSGELRCIQEGSEKSGESQSVQEIKKVVRWSQARVRVSPEAGRAPYATETGGSAAPYPATPSAPAAPPGPAPDGIPAGSAPGTRRARPAPAPPPGTTAPRSRRAAATATGRPGPGTALGGDGSGLGGPTGTGGPTGGAEATEGPKVLGWNHKF